MKGRVFQLIPVFREGDAIGHHALEIAKILGERHCGFIVQEADASLEHLSVTWTEAEVGSDDVLIYHAALGSQLAKWMHETDAVKVIDYHSITPSEFFRVYEPGLSVALANAWYELQALVDDVSLALAHSEYSRAELDAMGFENTATFPLLVDFSQYDIEPSPEVMDALATGKQGRGDILFVGRVAPNKRHEDLIKAFTVYRRCFNPAARLFLVGGTNSEAYSRTLEEFVDRLGIEGVHFAGRVSPPELVAYYRSADLFLSMSEHEGFGAPLLEAMYLGVPVLAYAAAAIPETVDEGGVLFEKKRYEEVAAIIDLLMRDEGARTGLIEAGTRRVSQFRPDSSRQSFLQAIEGLW